MTGKTVYVKVGGPYHESEDCAGDLAHERPLQSVKEASIKPCGVCVNE